MSLCVSSDSVSDLTVFAASVLVLYVYAMPHANHHHMLALLF
jgi:hypothetical protein